MAWNEPGKDPRDSTKPDPWRGQQPDGPPDLDEVMGKLRDQLSRLFGGGSGGRGGRGRGGRNDEGAPAGDGGSGLAGMALAALVLAGVWLASGFYIIGPAERGVVLRFGAYLKTVTPGWGWRLPPPIDSVYKVDVDQIFREQYKAQMLTKDENIVVVELTAQFRVRDPQEYFTHVRRPTDTLRHAMEGALREVVGANTMDYVLTEGRADVADKTGKLLQDILDRYKAGIRITKVNLQDAQPPEQVQGAFADAIKAREDEQRFINESEAYKAERLKNAEGSAYAVRKQAEGYAVQVVERATGEADRFGRVRTEYEKAPQVTRDRLYLEAMEQVLARASKIVVDVKNSGNLLYLPLDKLGAGGAAAVEGGSEVPVPPVLPRNVSSTAQGGARSDNRARDRGRERAR